MRNYYYIEYKIDSLFKGKKLERHYFKCFQYLRNQYQQITLVFKNNEENAKIYQKKKKKKYKKKKRLKFLEY